MQLITATGQPVVFAPEARKVFPEVVSGCLSLQDDPGGVHVGTNSKRAFCLQQDIWAACRTCSWGHPVWPCKSLGPVCSGKVEVRVISGLQQGSGKVVRWEVQSESLSYQEELWCGSRENRAVTNETLAEIQRLDMPGQKSTGQANALAVRTSWRRAKS